MTHLARASWLSKELIWLLPDSSCGLVASVQAWTDVYQLMVRGEGTGYVGEQCTSRLGSDLVAAA
jgi:hypothetical protein